MLTANKQVSPMMNDDSLNVNRSVQVLTVIVNTSLKLSDKYKHTTLYISISNLSTLYSSRYLPSL